MLRKKIVNRAFENFGNVVYVSQVVMSSIFIAFSLSDKTGRHTKFVRKGSLGHAYCCPSFFDFFNYVAIYFRNCLH